jgi:hypothetical protein
LRENETAERKRAKIVIAQQKERMDGWFVETHAILHFDVPKKKYESMESCKTCCWKLSGKTMCAIVERRERTKTLSLNFMHLLTFRRSLKRACEQWKKYKQVCNCYLHLQTAQL